MAMAPPDLRSLALPSRMQILAGIARAEQTPAAHHTSGQKADAKYLARAGPRTLWRVAHRNNRVEVGGSCAPAILARRGQSNAWAGGVKHAGS
jgi:hypothetical protein